MKKALIITALAVVALSPAAGEAAKSKPKKSCPSDSVCVWTKKGFKGKRVVVDGPGISNKIGNRINNKTSSIKNRVDLTIFIYDKRDGQGERRCVDGMGGVRNLGGSYNFDNRATSSDIPDSPEACL